MNIEYRIIFILYIGNKDSNLDLDLEPALDLDSILNRLISFRISARTVTEPCGLQLSIFFYVNSKEASKLETNC